MPTPKNCEELWNSLGLRMVVTPVPGANLNMKVCVYGDLMAVADGAEATEAARLSTFPIVSGYDEIDY